MATKLVENIDDKLWNKFVGYSKIKGKSVGETLNIIITKELKEEKII